MFKYNII